MIPVPDLLYPKPRLALDGRELSELLETSFLAGGRSGPALETALARPERTESSWQPGFFRDELFLDDLIKDCMRVEVDGRDVPVNRVFLRQVLCHPPVDLETIRFRQEILRELETDAELSQKTHSLYGQLFSLLSLFKAPHKGAKLDITVFRLEILELARQIVEFMAKEFGGAGSALKRLHETAIKIRSAREYRLLTALLDYEGHLAKVSFRIRIGADGKIRDLVLEDLVENVKNPFYKRPWRRMRDRIALIRRGFEFTNTELVNRVVHGVFLEISDWLRPLLQLLCHLSFYLSALHFRERAAGLGLEVSMAEIGDDGPLELEGLFNPLLFRQGTPVPCALRCDNAESIVIITGPNSGGKTRLLQAAGLAQLLGQSGLYAPAASARLPLVDGLYASTTERASVDQREGRLGTELVRIRQLFEAIGSRSLVLMDELCSGTNPSEAVEIFQMVLELLQRLSPVALITTHFLDFARRLESDPPVDDLQFLQVDMKGEESTYQFAPGVAATSLATTTARRLGVTLEELSRLIEPERRSAGH